MDGESIGFEDFRNCLRELEIVNVCTLAYRPTLRWLKKNLRGKSREPMSLLDVGSGGGGMLRKIWKLTRRRGREVSLTGVDLNRWSRGSEKFQAPGAPIRYETSDVFSLAPDRRADFIISSLFTHHLNDSEVVKFLQWIGSSCNARLVYQRSTPPPVALFCHPLCDARSQSGSHGSSMTDPYR